MANMETKEFKRDIVIKDFQKILTSMPTGTFLLFYFDNETIGTFHNFIVEVYPNGMSHANEGYVSLKISTTQCFNLTLQCTLSVVDTENSQLMPQSAICEDGNQRINCIFEEFVKHTMLMERKLEVLPDDVLTVHCEMNYFSNDDSISYNFIDFDNVEVSFNDDNIQFQFHNAGPYGIALNAHDFRVMHEELIRQSGRNVVKMDDMDRDYLLDFLDSLCSSSSRDMDSEFDRDASGCAEYATKIKAMTEHDPGLLGLAYMHRNQPLRCASKRLICHYVRELSKKLRDIQIYSVPASMQSSATLMAEFLTYRSRMRLEKLHDMFDILQLYIASCKLEIDNLKSYSGAYLVIQMHLADISFVSKLSNDYDDETLKRSIRCFIRQDKKKGLEETNDTSITSDDDTENPEEVISFIEKERRLEMQGRMQFYE